MGAAGTAAESQVLMMSYPGWMSTGGIETGRQERTGPTSQLIYSSVQSDWAAEAREKISSQREREREVVERGRRAGKQRDATITTVTTGNLWGLRIEGDLTTLSFRNDSEDFSTDELGLTVNSPRIIVITFFFFFNVKIQFKNISVRITLSKSTFICTVCMSYIRRCGLFGDPLLPN